MYVLGTTPVTCFADESHQIIFVGEAGEHFCMGVVCKTGSLTEKVYSVSVKFVLLAYLHQFTTLTYSGVSFATCFFHAFGFGKLHLYNSQY